MTSTELKKTLDVLSGEIDIALGREFGLAAKVERLAVVRAADKILNPRQDAWWKECVALAESGRRLLHEDQLMQRKAASAETLYEAVDTTLLKKRHPRAYAQAQRPTPWSRVTPPENRQPRVAAKAETLIGVIPNLPSGTPSPNEAARMYLFVQSRRASLQLTKHDEYLLAELNSLVDAGLWDGLPVITSDGWEFQTRRNQFNAEALLETSPDLHAQFTVIRKRQTAAGWFFGKPRAESIEDDDEIGIGL